MRCFSKRLLVAPWHGAPQCRWPGRCAPGFDAHRIDLWPALKVLSTTLPVSMFFSLVRTKAAPLPGLTWRNSTICHNPLLWFKTMPFLMPVLREFLVLVQSPPRFQPSRSGHRHANRSLVEK